MTRFSLRDVFWLMLVVGLALGWWLHVNAVKKEADYFIKGYVSNLKDMEDGLRPFDLEAVYDHKDGAYSRVKIIKKSEQPITPTK